MGRLGSIISFGLTKDGKTKCKNIKDEDYYNSGTTLEQAKKDLNWSTYSNIINRDVKLTRRTVEEIDEETFKLKIEKSNTDKATNKKSFTRRLYSRVRLGIVHLIK